MTGPMTGAKDCDNSTSSAFADFPNDTAIQPSCWSINTVRR